MDGWSDCLFVMRRMQFAGLAGEGTLGRAFRALPYEQVVALACSRTDDVKAFLAFVADFCINWFCRSPRSSRAADLRRICCADAT